MTHMMIDELTRCIEAWLCGRNAVAEIDGVELVTYENMLCYCGEYSLEDTIKVQSPKELATEYVTTFERELNDIIADSKH